MIECKWEKQTGRHQFGEWCRLGKVVVGSAYYDGGTSRNDQNKYAVTCLLPGIKDAREKYASMEDAKARLERMVRAWFSWVQS